MSIEKFDPHDPKYRKVKDLPRDQQPHYFDVEDGFVTQGAYLTYRGSADYPGDHGKLRRGLQEEAERENRERDRQRKDDAKWMPVIQELSGGSEVVDQLKRAGMDLSYFNFVEDQRSGAIVVNNVYVDYQKTLGDLFQAMVRHEYISGHHIGQYPTGKLEVTGKKLQALQDHVVDISPDGSSAVVDGVPDKYFASVERFKEGDEVEILIDRVSEEEYFEDSFLLRGSIQVVDCSEEIQGKSTGLRTGEANLIGDTARVKLSKGAVVLERGCFYPGETTEYEEHRHYKVCE